MPAVDKFTKPKTTQVRITFRCTKAFQARMLRIANKEGRTVNNWIIHQLTQAVKEHE